MFKRIIIVFMLISLIQQIFAVLPRFDFDKTKYVVFQNEYFTAKGNPKRAIVPTLNEKGYSIFPSKNIEDYDVAGDTMYHFENNQIVEIHYRGEGYINKTKYSFDKNGFVKSVLDGNGVEEIKYERDSNGNILKRIYTPLNEVELFQYDKTGRCVSLKLESVGGNIQYFYNEKNQLIREDVIWFGDTVNISNQFSYDKKGLLILEEKKTQEAGNSTVKYSYDKKQNIIKRITSYSEKSIIDEEDFIYDSKGNIIQIGSFTMKWEY